MRVVVASVVQNQADGIFGVSEPEIQKKGADGLRVDRSVRIHKVEILADRVHRPQGAVALPSARRARPNPLEAPAVAGLGAPQEVARVAEEEPNLASAGLLDPGLEQARERIRLQRRVW